MTEKTFSADTLEAVKRFHAQAGLTIDGVAGKLKGERLESCRGNRGGKGKPVKAPRK